MYEFKHERFTRDNQDHVLDIKRRVANESPDVEALRGEIEQLRMRNRALESDLAKAQRAASEAQGKLAKAEATIARLREVGEPAAVVITGATAPAKAAGKKKRRRGEDSVVETAVNPPPSLPAAVNSKVDLLSNDVYDPLATLLTPLPDACDPAFDSSMPWDVSGSGHSRQDVEAFLNGGITDDAATTVTDDVDSAPLPVAAFPLLAPAPCDDSGPACEEANPSTASSCDMHIVAGLESLCFNSFDVDTELSTPRLPERRCSTGSWDVDIADFNVGDFQQWTESLDAPCEESKGDCSGGVSPRSHTSLSLVQPPIDLPADDVQKQVLAMSSEEQQRFLEKLVSTMLSSQMLDPAMVTPPASAPVSAPQSPRCAPPSASSPCAVSAMAPLGATPEVAASVPSPAAIVAPSPLTLPLTAPQPAPAPFHSSSSAMSTAVMPPSALEAQFSPAVLLACLLPLRLVQVALTKMLVRGVESARYGESALGIAAASSNRNRLVLAH